MPGGGLFNRQFQVAEVHLQLVILQDDQRLIRFYELAVANQDLVGLAEYAADPATSVLAGFRTFDGSHYAVCSLGYEALVVGDDGIAYYAVYGLSLKVDQSGLIEGSGSCIAIDPAGTPLPAEQVLPAVAGGDVVDITVRTPPMSEILTVLMGGF